MKTRLFLTSIALLLAATAGLATAQTAPVKLRFGHTLPANDSQHLAALEFSKRVKERTQGGVEIQVFANSQLGNDSTLINSVRSGTIDIGATGNPFFTGLAPRLNVLDLPYQFTDAQQLYRVLDGPTGRSLLDDLGAHQLKGLAFWEIGFRSLANNKRQVSKAEDIKGLKIRTTPVYRAFFRTLGADLIQTAPGDVFIALERGTIDGYGWPSWDLKTTGWDKHTKYRVEPGFYAVANATIINLDKWKSLTDKQRDFLTQHSRKFETEYDTRYAPKTAAYLKEQADAGVQVIEFKGKVAEDYIKTAYESAWAEFQQLDPENTPKLKALISD